jgi:hypothetical protein
LIGGSVAREGSNIGSGAAFRMSPSRAIETRAWWKSGQS